RRPWPFPMAYSVIAWKVQRPVASVGRVCSKGSVGSKPKVAPKITQGAAKQQRLLYLITLHSNR
ncbi:hypothetical protein J6590_076053, partial [Homalodisca vitripennis]